MKISQSLLFAYAAAQGEDRWGSTDYYSFNYGFGDNGGRQDAGLAFGLSENTVQGSPSDATNYGGLESLYMVNNESAHYKNQLHFNGLLCWMCDYRLDLATEAETEDCTTSSCQNAYARCLKHGMLMRCRGEQRTCMFEERRRHGVVYSVCTGCKQTDACVAHWRRNQRFTLPFMNFGDMSLRNLPTSTDNLLQSTMDQLPNHRPIYVDDECSTFQETRTEAAWRTTQDSPSSGIGYNGEVYPMGWIPTGQTRESTPNTGGTESHGYPFSAGFVNDGTAQVLQFTGHRVNMGLSYSKFAYDGASNLQLNAQLSQWESTCRWCCHARPDAVCNIEMKEINSSPFATKCGNNHGTRRSEQVDTLPDNATTAQYRYPIHPIATHLAKFATAIDGATSFTDSQRTYWSLLDTMTGLINAVEMVNVAQTADTPPVRDYKACSLSNAQWDLLQGNSDLTAMTQNNRAKTPQGIHGKFRFFQPFNIAQSNADYFNSDQKTCDTASTTNFGKYCTVQADCQVASAGDCTVVGAYEQGPRFWMQMFQRTPQYDLSHWFNNSAAPANHFTAKFPSVGEGRNSAGMDKFAGRGNKSRWELGETALRGNPELQHFFQQQTDMTSQENRDFLDSRARDAATSQDVTNVYLKRWDNGFWTNK